MEQVAHEFSREQAIAWYVQGYDLQTIADHFKLTLERLKELLNTEIR